MPGIRIHHKTLRWPSIALIPVQAKPYGPGGIDCPTCQTVHLVKTVHLWLNDQGDCLVSEGVLDELQSAGMPDLTIVGYVPKPPPLNLGPRPGDKPGEQRTRIDRDNRTIHVWTSKEIANG